jgi:hypothetical protein
MAIQQIEFRCTDDTYGMPFPPIPDGSIVILVQDGRAEVGRYEEPRPPDEPSPAFDHPANAADLSADALRAVLAAFPHIDLNGPAVTFTCPAELAARAVWPRPHRG